LNKHDRPISNLNLYLFNDRQPAGRFCFDCLSFQKGTANLWVSHVAHGSAVTFLEIRISSSGLFSAESAQDAHGKRKEQENAGDYCWSFRNGRKIDIWAVQNL
jgi:hypothetical protein